MSTDKLTQSARAVLDAWGDAGWTPAFDAARQALRAEVEASEALAAVPVEPVEPIDRTTIARIWREVYGSPRFDASGELFAQRIAAAARAHPAPQPQQASVAPNDALPQDEFWRACSLMPTDVSWEDSLTPALVLQIAALASKQAPPEWTPEMSRAVQLYSELGAYAAANLSGAYDLFEEFWRIAIQASRPAEAQAKSEPAALTDAQLDALMPEHFSDAWLFGESHQVFVRYQVRTSMRAAIAAIAATQEQKP